VRVELAGIFCEDVGRTPPADVADLGWVGREQHVSLAGEHEPQADVKMPVVLPDRSGDGHEDRSCRTISEERRDAQLLLGLPPRRVGGVLVRVDVRAGWQPQSRVDVVDEQGAAVGVDQDDVGHEVPIRRCRLHSAEDVVGGLQPAQGVEVVLLLQLVPRPPLCQHGLTDRCVITERGRGDESLQ